MTDAEAVSAFEALLLKQVPAKVPWQPVTDYDLDSRIDVEGKTPDLLIATFTDAKGRPPKMLDAGCGFGHLVRMLLERGADACGFDIQSRPEWIQSPKYKQGDVTEVEPFRGDFDLVICREVLEHLTVKQILKAVTQLCKASKRYVYVTTRFNPDPQHLLDVATSDALDPTHISLLNQECLRLLFVLEGFSRRPDLETAMDWQQKGRVLVYERN